MSDRMNLAYLANDGNDILFTSTENASIASSWAESSGFSGAVSNGTAPTICAFNEWIVAAFAANTSETALLISVYDGFAWSDPFTPSLEAGGPAIGLTGIVEPSLVALYGGAVVLCINSGGDNIAFLCSDGPPYIDWRSLSIAGWIGSGTQLSIVTVGMVGLGVDSFALVGTYETGQINLIIFTNFNGRQVNSTYVDIAAFGANQSSTNVYAGSGVSIALTGSYLVIVFFASQDDGSKKLIRVTYVSLANVELPTDEGALYVEFLGPFNVVDTEGVSLTGSGVVALELDSFGKLVLCYVDDDGSNRLQISTSPFSLDVAAEGGNPFTWSVPLPVNDPGDLTPQTTRAAPALAAGRIILKPIFGPPIDFPKDPTVIIIDAEGGVVARSDGDSMTVVITGEFPSELG